MLPKIAKILSKIIVLFPFTLGLWVLMFGLNSNNWFLSAIAGLVISTGIVFWNVFDYEKYDQMDAKDFLESNHNLSIDNNNENWNHINKMLETPLADIKKVTKTENSVKIHFGRLLSTQAIYFTRSDSAIEVTISRKGFFKFLPDNAKNYRMLQRIDKELI